MTAPTAVIKLRAEPAYRREAFEKGLKRLGYTLATKHGIPSSKDDLLVLWNRKRGTDELDANLWELHGGTVIVVENAYLQKVDKSAYAISTHGHNGSGWFPFDPTGNRFSALGFDLKDLRSSGAYVLVCGQRGVGSKLMASPPQWAEKMVATVSSERQQARLRAHPGNFAPKVPLLQDLAGARECRIWSSGAGVRALVEGVAVKHYAPHWICEGWEKDRAAALNRMSWGQWSVAEIESGEPFARMREHNWGPRWA